MNKNRILIHFRSLVIFCIVIIMSFMMVNPGAARDQKTTGATTSLVEYVAGGIDTLDPALAYDTASSHIIYQVYDTLLFYDRERTDVFTPMLATSWTISPDGLTYVFNIRKGVQFHNGNSLTPSDVAYTFQRGLLQGGTNSPQGLLTEPIFGYGITDVSYLVDPSGALLNNRAALQDADPTALLSACQAVTGAIVANDTAGTVTMTLEQAWSPMLITLAGSWGSIMDKEWTIANGGWDGNCDHWQNYYYMDSSYDPFTAIENGTGPFYLDYWNNTSDGDIGLLRNDDYWRQVSEPMWFGAPGGPAYFTEVLIHPDDSEENRYNALVSGTADLAESLRSYYSALDGQTLFYYTEPDGLTPELVNTGGTLKGYDRISNTAYNYSFVYEMNTGGPRNYVGSGTFDGNGIPNDFFNDLYVRRAFSYAFDYDQFITDVYGGDAFRLRGPIPAGVMGYSDTSWIYDHDPVEAENQMKLAWGGVVDDLGFTMSVAYYATNPSVQAFANRIKTDIEALNPKYHINLISMTYAEYVSDRNNYYLPLIAAGWMGDIPHPHNWVVPYMTGTYAMRQRIPEATRDAYAIMIANCLAQTGSAAVTCYEGLQSTAIEAAIDIFPAQATGRTYMTGAMRGFYDNPYLAGIYFYALDKNALPTLATLTPSGSIAVGFNTAGGGSDQLSIPTGAVTDPYDIAVTSDTRVTHFPIGTRPARPGFDIDAFDTGVLVDELSLSNPALINLSYGTSDITGLVEDQLKLYYWDGNSWEDASCGTIISNTIANTLQVPICHLSNFALGSDVSTLFLPLLNR